MTTVYLADLRHNYSGVLGNDCVPLSVAYIKAVMDRDLPEVESRVFAYPDRLEQAMHEQPPDVLMVGNYCWNQALGDRFARLAKQLRPQSTVVQGGPNISLEPERRIAYLAEHPALDVYVLGEADFTAPDLVRRLLEVDGSVERLGELDIPSCIYRRPDGTIAYQPEVRRTRALDDIPSPWLTGVLDEFFDGKLAPLVETNRGCPFTCTFCVQGTSYYDKVRYFSEERVREEFTYIARRIKDRCPSMGTLRIADPNYGMYQRDTDLSGHLGALQKEYGWPTFIDATTGKNRPERVIASVEKSSGAMVLYHAVQSLDEDVLRNIKRQNIKLAAYEQLRIHMRGRGLRSMSQLILALPGETRASHFAALRKLVDAGINKLQNFQLMLLKGTELETLDTRRTFTFTSKYRVLPKTFGIYGDEKVFDIEEVVVSTDTLSFDDYLAVRTYHLGISVFWNDSWFEDAFRFAEVLGIKPSECMDAILASLETTGGAMGAFRDSFLAETRNELFETREDCARFYAAEENFQKLLNGDIGDNLMYKYQAIASFHLWPDVCRLAMEAIAGIVTARAASSGVQGVHEFWSDLHRYVELKHASGRTEAEMLVSASTTLHHDIPRWVADGYPRDLGAYRLDRPMHATFRLSDEAARELSAALRVWDVELKGLTKMVTRMRVAWQIRDCELHEAVAV
jgi:radical SAM superfamily enzyme YgiQ (UPF0313 family)